MRFLQNFVDERLGGCCAHCGGFVETRDHVISKVLLDEPYPENLPVVPACTHCNNKISADEEYFACLLECVVCGSVNPEKLGRKKICKILGRKRSLMARISSSQTIVKGTVSFVPEMQRVQDVVLKLARGHILYEHGEPRLDHPRHVSIMPLHMMDYERRVAYEHHAPPASLLIESNFSGWPEVGSRAVQRIVQGNAPTLWIDAQHERYRYFITSSHLIRIVLSEYLGCEVYWD